MLRTFAEHDVRFTEPLDGVWDFATAEDRRDRKKLPGRYSRRIHVPSAWETTPGLETYRGRAWYRTGVCAVDGTALRLVFGGVSHTGTAYIDGKRVATHYDAFTPWDVVVTGLATGPHELVLEVDNSFGSHSALHLPNDYYTYGGITRPAEMQLVPPAYIDKVFARPERGKGNWALDVTVWLKNWSPRAVRRRVVVTAAGGVADLGTVTLQARSGRRVKGRVSGLDVKEWTAETPDLYFVESALLAGDDIVDDMVDRIGFRDVKVKGKKLLLNGRPIHLRGYNRHEDHPNFGCSLPVAAMALDLQIIRDLGCNFVRTCHYPNDMRFLDLCDEMGFYVWEESHARQVKFDHPKFREQIRTSTEEMIAWHYNRPCIIIWGCLNECDTSTRAGRAEHKRVLDLIRKLDPSRPNTYAGHLRKRDTCEGLCDIVSWNLHVGWYADHPEDAERVLRDLLKWKNSAASRGGSGKPVMISEFGGGAIYGNRTPNQSHWSEEYQAKVLDENLAVYLNHREVVGAAIWQFCDVRITEEGGVWKGRPRTMNNKGTVDEFRRPKLAYDIVKKRMRAARRAQAGAGSVKSSMKDMKRLPN